MAAATPTVNCNHVTAYFGQLTAGKKGRCFQCNCEMVYDLAAGRFIEAFACPPAPAHIETTVLINGILDRASWLEGVAAARAAISDAKYDAEKYGQAWCVRDVEVKWPGD